MRAHFLEGGGGNAAAGPLAAPSAGGKRGLRPRGQPEIDYLMNVAAGTKSRDSDWTYFRRTCAGLYPVVGGEVKQIQFNPIPSRACTAAAQSDIRLARTSGVVQNGFAHGFLRFPALLSWSL
jgi:hypothetical protein